MCVLQSTKVKILQKLNIHYTMVVLFLLFISVFFFLCVCSTAFTRFRLFVFHSVTVTYIYQHNFSPTITSYLICSVLTHIDLSVPLQSHTTCANGLNLTVQLARSGFNYCKKKKKKSSRESLLYTGVYWMYVNK